MKEFREEKHMHVISTMLSKEQISEYETLGYVIVPDLIPPALFVPLQDACDQVVVKTREGKWKERRVVGKQFPPYDSDNPDSWGVQHLMHPELGEKVFSEWYENDGLVGAVKQLLQCEEKDLQMELFNLLINPLNHDFALRWHRDDVRGDASADEERKALDKWGYGVQWNTALYEDSCLYVVPGSHKVLRTEEQKAHSTTMDAPENPLDMPGAVRVTVKPGQTLFYNSNILHCATYNSKLKRATLHATMGNAAGGDTRARNILQHNLTWMTDDPRFSQNLGLRGKQMLKNLLKMRDAVGEQVGFSLEN